MTFPSTIEGNEPEAAGGFVGPIMDSNGNLYRVTEELLADGNHPMMMKSTDDGETWSRQDTNNGPSGSGAYNDMESAWLVHRPTENEVVLCYMKAQSRWWGISFRTSDHPTNPDTWDTGTFATSSGQDQFGTQASESGIAAAVLSDGTVRAFIRGTPQSSNQAFLHRTKATTSWDTGSTYITHASVDMTRPSCVVGESDTTYLFYKDQTNGRVYYRTVSSGGTVGSPTRVDSGGAGTGASYENNVVPPVYYDDAGDEVIVVGFVNSSNQLRTVEIRNGSVGSEQQVHADAVSVDPGTTDNMGPAAALAVHGTTLYAIWGDASTGDLYYATRANGGSWSSRTLLADTGTGGSVLWVYANVVGSKLGFTYDIGPHDDTDVSITYNFLGLGQSVNVNQVTETDTVRPVSFEYDSEVDEAFSITVRFDQNIPVGRVSESDVALTINVGGKIVNLGLATEVDESPLLYINKQTEFALPMSVVSGDQPVNQDVNQVTETDLAQTVGRSKTYAVGLVTETDLAQTFALAKAQDVNQVTEADTAQTVGRVHQYAVGLNSETDLAQNITVQGDIQVPVNQVTETDLAQTVGRSKRYAAGLVVETDTAQTVGRLKAQDVNQTTETDVAQVFGRLKAQDVNQVTETDLAQIISPQGEQNIPVGLVTETDLAQTFARAKAQDVNQVTETDLAQAVGRLKAQDVNQVTETDLAGDISGAGQVNQVTETDLALSITARKRYAVAQTTETNTAQTVARVKVRGVGITQTTSTAQVFTHAKRKTFGLVVETDTAQPVSGGSDKNIPVGLVTETDTARTVARVKTWGLGLVVEVDQGSSIQRRKTVHLGVTTEISTALELTQPARLGTATLGVRGVPSSSAASRETPGANHATRTTPSANGA